MDFSFLSKYIGYFNYGALVTIIIAFFVVFFGSILGLLLALAQRSKWKVLVWFANLYVWIFRGTPMLVQIMIAFSMMHLSAPTFQLGVLSVDLTRLIPGIVILSMNSGAYVSETIRAGINAVPKGQLEAAFSLGIRPVQAMRYVIMPQAIKNILPALGNEFVTIVKDSSLLATIGVIELWNGAGSVATMTYLTREPYFVAAAYYLMMTSILTFAITRFEKKLNKGGQSHD
ncbi:amino acid ABC transporter permease [Streptococcus suis]|uniref:Amino acid ABC transporter permease n=1 Tax=Streptococcus suis TaxID=1307 RepID=A0A4T2GNU7_STRSU|nr:amino acid ABC transporter permease [Streptococcus suis]MBM7269654.1 amino acid ABC transporter permease [Streptococcus suis]TII00412.1 amino acid ABC transporter permease [Streptococcus suis]